MIENRSVRESNFIERTVPSVHYRLLALLPKREWKMGSILRAHSAFGLSQFHDELWQHLEHASTPWTVNYHIHRIKVCKVNSVHKASTNCFAVRILKFEILPIPWKKWNKEHQTPSFQFFTITFSILNFFGLFFHVVCKISNFD